MHPLLGDGSARTAGPLSATLPISDLFPWLLSGCDRRIWRLSSSVFSKLFVPRETNLPPNMLFYWRLEEFPVMPKSWACLDHPSMLIGVAYLGNMIYRSGAGNRTLFLSVALR